MIVFLGEPNSGFAMSDGLVEPAEGGKRRATQVLRHCQWDPCHSEALSAQLAVESDDLLEQFGCFAVVALGAARIAKIGRCDHLDGPIAEGARDGERLV